jgi:hypothetical protein
MVLDGQEGDSVGVRGLKERYWMRFLKGMVTDRNTRPSEDDKARASFPAETPATLTTCTAQGTPTSNRFIIVAPMSTSTLATEATEHQQSSASTTIIPPPATERGSHRAAFQTTIDDLGELVQRFNNLAIEERNQRFREAAANIPPSRGRHGRRAVVQRRGQAGGEDQEVPV